MSGSYRQRGSGIAPVDPRTPLWKGAGAPTAFRQASAAVLWEGIAVEAAKTALVDAKGLPVPSFARALVRLSGREAGIGRNAAAVALRYARINGRRVSESRAPVVLVEGGNTLYLSSKRGVATEEIDRIWARQLKAGRCSILSTVGGQLRGGVVRHVEDRLERRPQRPLFHDVAAVERILQRLSDATIRRNLRPRR